jgi:hypothetical protein
MAAGVSAKRAAMKVKKSGKGKIVPTEDASLSGSPDADVQHQDIQDNASALFGPATPAYHAKHKALIRRTKGIVLDSHHATKCVQKRHAQKIFLFDLVVYLIFMSVYFMTLVSQFQITSSFELERSMRDYMKQEDLESVKTLEDAFDYLEQKLLPQLFPNDNWYNGDAYAEDEKGFILNYNKLVAGFSLIQQRVDTNVTCVASKRFAEFLPECWPALSPESTSSAVFGQQRNPIQYMPDAGTSEFSQTFPLDSELSMFMLNELKRNRWLDKQSRTVEAAFVIFNSAKQMFCLVSIKFQHLETGKIEWEQAFTTFSLEPYLTRTPTNEMLFAFFALYYAIHLLVDITRKAMHRLPPRAKQKQRGSGAFAMVTHGVKKAWTVLCAYLEALLDGWVFVEIWRLMFCLIICESWVALLNHPENKALELPVGGLQV